MRSSLIILLVLMVLIAKAQSEFSLYRMNANLPESNLLNPAFAPNHKVVIGLPVVSSLYFSGDTDGLSFRDIFKTTEDDSLKLDTLSLFRKLKPSNRIQLKESIQLFYFGLRGKKSYFSFGIHQVSETRFNYPGDLVGWAFRGPANSHYLGKPLDFGNFYGRSIWYNKISINYSRDVTQNLRVGVRVNYLLGLASGETTKLHGKLTVGIDSVNIRTDEIQIQTGGIDFFDQDNLSASDYKNYFLKGKNKGMSIDIGGTYNLTDNITLSAAVNDLGYINWKEYTRSYNVAPVNYTFKGFDLLDYLNKNPGDEFLQAQIDSLQNAFTATETTGQSFKTSLVGKLYAGANLRLLRVNNFSALFYLDMFQKKISPAFSLGYNLQLGRTLNSTIGVTFANGKISNIGAGIALKLTHLQFYASSDRGNSFVYPSRASRVDARFGMNLVFGRVTKKDKSKSKKTDESEVKKDTVDQKQPITSPAEDLRKDSVVQEAPQPKIDANPVQRDTSSIQEQPIVVAPDVIKEVPIEPAKVDSLETTTPTVVEKIQEPIREVTVKKGEAKDELPVSHYIIVGAFRNKENAKRYSDQLKREGHNNEYGFVTEKAVYYVYLRKISDLAEARRIRNEYRNKPDFEFPNSWILTVED